MKLTWHTAPQVSCADEAGRVLRLPVLGVACSARRVASLVVPVWSGRLELGPVSAVVVMLGAVRRSGVLRTGLAVSRMMRD